MIPITFVEDNKDMGWLLGFAKLFFQFEWIVKLKITKHDTFCIHQSYNSVYV